MDSPQLIRNIALCGHLHHGKVRGYIIAVTAYLAVKASTLYNYILAISTRSAFFSMKAVELKCQNLIIIVRKYVKWNILRHFAKRSAQYSVCKDQK